MNPEVILISNPICYNNELSDLLRVVLLKKNIVVYYVKSFRDFRDFRDLSSEERVKFDLSLEDRKPRYLEYEIISEPGDFELLSLNLLLQKNELFWQRDKQDLDKYLRKELWTPNLTKVALDKVTGDKEKISLGTRGWYTISPNEEQQNSKNKK